MGPAYVLLLSQVASHTYTPVQGAADNRAKITC
jgi:hypothetical protein